MTGLDGNVLLRVGFRYGGRGVRLPPHNLFNIHLRPVRAQTYREIILQPLAG